MGGSEAGMRKKKFLFLDGSNSSPLKILCVARCHLMVLPPFLSLSLSLSRTLSLSLSHFSTLFACVKSQVVLSLPLYVFSDSATRMGHTHAPSAMQTALKNGV